ncbi:MAG: ThiF family adenylyltransferase [Planctomycetota bacterium]
MSSIKIPNLRSDRTGTLKLMSWWQADKVASAKVMVVGAGALGNEVLKNLALMGIGHFLIVDRDRVEMANLSRSVLFRTKDEGKLKTEVAVTAIKELNPEVKTMAWDGDINLDLGLGFFRRMSVIIGCLDNRQARLSVNRFCYKVGKPWVDGAIQELFGVARVFHPGIPKTACYECTLSAKDWEILAQAYPCKGIALANILLGKVPTTPTISSIIAGVESQEALKIIHGMEDFLLAGEGMIFNGLINDTYKTKYTPHPDCESHFTYPDIETTPFRARETSLREVMLWLKQKLGPQAALEIDREIIVSLVCPECHQEELILKPQGKVFEQEALCPKCQIVREVETTHYFYGNEAFADRTLYSLGIPELHILTGISEQKTLYFELTGDEQLLNFQ